MEAVLEAPTKARAKAVAAPKILTAVPATAPFIETLPLDARSRMEGQLHSVAAALTMMEMVFSGDVLDEPKQCEGLMGTIQYVEKSLRALDVEQQDRPDKELGHLYWHVFHAASLATVFETVLLAQGYTWNLPDDLIPDYLAAINGNVKGALAALQTMGGAA